MPKVNVTLPDTSETITRPIIFDIIKQVSDITKISPNTQVFFPGSSGVMHTNDSTIDTSHLEMSDRYATFKTNYISFIDVEETYDEDNLSTTAVNIDEYEPIFSDELLGLYIRPIYASTNITINFKYTCPSKTEALKWRDDIRVKVSQMRDINLHDLTYQYLIPHELYALVRTVYDRRENVAPYGESLYTYMTTHSTSKLTLVGDLIGKDARLSIAEKQTRVLGMYGWDAIPEPPERDESGVWVISFSYKFRYDKPIACMAQYPIMVHNQLLPPEYTTYVTEGYDLDNVKKLYRKSLSALNGFESDTIINDIRDKPDYFKLPSFDDFIIENHPTGTGTIWNALCEVDTTDKKTLLNLTELGDLTLDADVLQFIQDGEWKYLTQLYKSIFHISLYRNNYLARQDTIDVDSNLDVKAITELDLRKQFRVRFSIVADWTLLTSEAVDRLRLNPSVIVKVVKAINSVLRHNEDLYALTNRSRVTINDFSLLFALLTGQGYGNGTGVWLGSGRGTSLWTNNNSNVSDIQSLLYGSNVLKSLDPKVLEDIRRNKIQSNTVLETSIIASRR